MHATFLLTLKQTEGVIEGIHDTLRQREIVGGGAQQPYGAGRNLALQQIHEVSGFESSVTLRIYGLGGKTHEC